MDEQYSIYNIDLKIDADNQHLYSNVKLDFYCNLQSTNILNFYIHSDMEIEDITCNIPFKYEIGEKIADWSPFILESKLIKLSFDKPILKGQKISIYFKYKGYINIVTKYGINRLTSDWIELGMYTPWFPLHESFREAIFNVIIGIDDKYKVINSSKVRDKLIINQSVPQPDSTIIASKDFKIIANKLQDIIFNVYYIEDRHKEIAIQISKHSSTILNKYKDIGKVNINETSIVIAPRKEGGGYCRPGLIVLTPTDNSIDEVRYFKFIAHELAHLWWFNMQNANTWEDWLNESFAEYSALRALRDYYGEDEFNCWIDVYKQQTKNLPPIKNLDRGHEKAFEVLYMKGPVALNALENSIGKKKFEELLNKTYQNNVDTTNKFLDILSELTNPDVVDKFNNLLLK